MMTSSSSGKRSAPQQTFTIRDPRAVPLYCNPFQLFFTEWALMLGTFLLRISYASFPDFSVAFKLFVLASASFLLGYFTLKLSYPARQHVPLGVSDTYIIRIDRLRRFHLLAVALVCAIIVMNWKRFGLPPIFIVFGAQDTLSYQEYGSLRQPKFTALLMIFISAPLEPSALRRWLLYLFSPACFLLYGSRGYLLIMLFQALAIFSLRTQKSKRFIYTAAAATFGIAVTLTTLIGNNRSSYGVDALLGFLQIRQRYYHWPAAYLWVISYITTPFSNMCWILQYFPYRHPTLNFIYSALPGFWSTFSLEQVGDLGSEKIIDGVHTYMAKYYLDFWYFGIVGINVVWGLIAAGMQAGNRLTRNFLLSGVLLGCMAFMFFSDFLSILIILMELLAAVLMQRYMVVPVRPQAAAT